MANIADFSNRADELPEQEFQPIPDGWYQTEIKKAELKPTKDGTGEYINVQYSVLGPAHAGRVVFGMINVRNKNPEAETIGLRQLKELRAACGLAVLRDTDELVGRNVEINVKTQKSEEYGDRNTVAKIRSAGGSSPMPKPGASATPAPGGSTPPWARK